MMMTMHTRVFGAFAALTACPSVTLLSVLALNPDFPIAIYTGWLFTHSALICVGFGVATLVSGICDFVVMRS